MRLVYEGLARFACSPINRKCITPSLITMNQSVWSFLIVLTKVMAKACDCNHS